MDTSVLSFYDGVAAEMDSLPKFNEMLFYTGSPDAEIVVISEAPTLPNGPADHTLYHTVTEEMRDRSVEEIADFLRSYPFRTGERNDLFREYVDRILGFCDQPEEEIGFTDLCKQPLVEFGNGMKLEGVWNDTAYSREDVLMAQLRWINPEIVVCNKKNVSRLLSQAYLGAEGYSGEMARIHMGPGGVRRDNVGLFDYGAYADEPPQPKASFRGDRTPIRPGIGNFIPNLGGIRG